MSLISLAIVTEAFVGFKEQGNFDHRENLPNNEKKNVLGQPISFRRSVERTMIRYESKQTHVEMCTSSQASLTIRRRFICVCVLA